MYKEWEETLPKKLMKLLGRIWVRCPLFWETSHISMEVAQEPSTLPCLELSSLYMILQRTAKLSSRIWNSILQILSSTSNVSSRRQEFRWTLLDNRSFSIGPTMTNFVKNFLWTRLTSLRMHQLRILAQLQLQLQFQLQHPNQWLEISSSSFCSSIIQNNQTIQATEWASNFV